MTESIRSQPHKRHQVLQQHKQRKVNVSDGVRHLQLDAARKECSKGGLEKMEEAFQNLITPEDILAFEKSEDATSAVKLVAVAPSQKF